MTEPSLAPRRAPRILAAILILLVVAGAAAAFALDRVLTSLARDQAGRLAAAWQRPVEVGAVRTTFLTGLGVRVEAVRIGAAAGESRPLLELDRAEAKLELFRALLSGGREVRIRSAELQGLRVTVLRRADGSTNVQRLADAVAGDKPSGPPEVGPPPGGEKGADLSRLRIEHAALLGARITFVDEAAGGRELFIDKLDVVADGLAAGAPLEVQLKASILSATQNLALRVHAPPLPVTLIPAPDRITVQLEAVDLTPLAAFAPRQAGFLGGRLQADLDVALGAAVPGGAGPTTVRGGFVAAGLRFAGQEGGKALDVVLDADLSADAARGDLSIGRLRLAFGPAVLEGKGRVTGLGSERPVVEGLRVLTRQLDLAALAAYYPPLPGLLGGTVAGPIGLSLKAAGTAERPVVELRADLTPVRLAFARRFEKAAGGRLVFTGHLRGGAGGTLGFDAEADLAGLDLRPGGTLAKKPGDRFTLGVAGSRGVAGQKQAIEIGSLSMSLLDTTVEAHGTAELAKGSTRFDLAVKVDRVDVDTLLLPAPPAEASPRPAAAGKDAPSPWAGLAGRCTLQVGEATARKNKVTNLRAIVRVKEDEVAFEEARFGLWSGTVSLAGTRARLAPADRPFTLAARVEGVQVAQAMAAWTDHKVLTGRLDTEVALSGKGEAMEALLEALDGTVRGKLLDGIYLGKDLVAEVSEPLAKAIPSLKRRSAGGGATSLGKLVPFSLRVQQGRAAFQEPMEVNAQDFTATVRGSATLGGDLDLPITMRLGAGVVSDLTGGRARIKVPVPLTFVIKGKAWSPRLADVEVGPAAKAIGEALGVQAIGKALGLGGSSPNVAKEAGATKAKATEEAEAAKKKAREDADAARKKLEQDGKKALKKLLGG